MLRWLGHGAACDLICSYQRPFRLRVVGAHALAVDVSDEHVVAEFGQTSGCRLLVVADACPLVDHEYARPHACIGIVVGLPTFTEYIISLVLDRALNNTSATEATESKEG